MSRKLDEARAKYPAYAKLSDADLADALYDKFYRDLPRATFDKKVADSGNPFDMISAGVVSGVNALPIVGPAVMDGLSHVKGWAHGVPVEDIRTDNDRLVTENPVSSTVGGIAGTVLPFVAGGEIPVAARMLGIDGSVATVPRAIINTGASLGITAADKATRGY